MTVYESAAIAVAFSLSTYLLVATYINYKMAKNKVKAANVLASLAVKTVELIPHGLMFLEHCISRLAAARSGGHQLDPDGPKSGGSAAKLLSPLVNAPEAALPEYLGVTLLDVKSMKPKIVRLKTRILKWLIDSQLNHRLSGDGMDAAFRLYVGLTAQLKLWTPDAKIVAHDDRHGRHDVEALHAQAGLRPSRGDVRELLGGLLG